MTPRAKVIPLRKHDNRESQVRDLLSESRIEDLRQQIGSGEYKIDADKIADHVVDDIKK